MTVPTLRDRTEADRSEAVDLRIALRGMWTQLPVLLIGSVMVSLAAGAGLLLARVSVPLGLLAVALLVAPTTMALIACAGSIVDGEDVGVGDYFAALRSVGPRAIVPALVPAVLVILTLTALLAYRLGGGVFLVPTGLGTTVTVLGLVALLVALPLRVRHERPRGIALWMLALHVFARTPVPFLAAGCVAGLGTWAAASLSNGLFVLVPAPFAIVLSAAYLASPAERMLV